MAISDQELKHTLNLISTQLKTSAERIRTWSDVVKQTSEDIRRSDLQKAIEQAYKKRVLIETKTSMQQLSNLEKSAKAYEQNQVMIDKIRTNLATSLNQFKKLQEEYKKLDRTDPYNLAKIEAFEKEIAARQEQEQTLKELERANEELARGFEQTAKSIKMINLKEFGTSIFQNTIQFYRSKAGLLAFGAAVLQLHRQTLDTYRYARGFLESESSSFVGIVQNFWNALKQGITPQELAELSAANRQAVLASGGQQKVLELYTQQLKDGTSIQDKYFKVTGNMKDALTGFMENITILRRAGIKPTQEALSSMADDIISISKMTGTSLAEINGRFAEMFNQDIEMQTLLRSAREQERALIIENTRAMIKQNIAIGMTAEQAFSAAKMLNKMVAAKPLERIKQAARIRALGAALGIGGAEEAAQALIAGPRARTPEQKKALEDFSKAAATQADVMRGMGLAQEIFSEQLLDKLDLDQYYGRGSPFSTTQLEANRPIVEGLKPMDDKLAGIFMLLERLTNAISSLTPVVTAGVGFLGILAAIFTIRSGTKAISELPELLRGGKGAIITEGAATGGKLAGISRFLAGVGRFALGGLGVGAAGTVGYGIGTLINNTFGDSIASLIDKITGLEEKNKELLKPTPLKQTNELATQVKKSTEEQTNVSQANTDIFKEQLSKMNQSTIYLKTIAEMTEKQVQMSEKILIASTMSEEERKKLSQQGAMTRLQWIKNVSADYQYVI